MVKRAWSSRAALPHPDLEEKATGFFSNGLYPEKALSQSGRIDSVDCQSLPALIRLARPLPVVSLPPSEDIVNCCRHPHSKICGSYSADYSKHRLDCAHAISFFFSTFPVGLRKT